ncbi:MAG: methionyl-tRNA formyltransferase [Candidatus Omnitrophica bacterium]|nr:methionyl-tRNA formyltransferase [Candidatus Omnitrophota bacterium]MDD5591944.1 methionyl-tRNA formyltransferase [Candidatus Omnitrophota bacterium]
MNIIFFGSSHFAVASLKALLSSKHRISCVVTQPDKKKGRGLAMGATQVKAVARESGLDIYQPERINTAQALGLLKGLEPDLFVVIAYGQILSENVLAIPKILAINVHASILPKYRGAAPINWSIINADKTTGITVIKMVREMDAGPVIMQKKIGIAEDDTAVTLENKLSKLAAELLLTCLESVENNNYKLAPQDKDNVTFAPKLKKEDGKIDWGKPAEDIHNLIKGCLPWPGAFTYYKGKLLKIYQADVVKVSKCQSVKVSGEITEVSKEGIAVVTGRDDLIIRELQIEGRKIMETQDFIKGHKISAGEKLL